MSYLKAYDPETGVELEESIRATEQAEIAKVIKEGQSLEQMQRTAGWKLVQEFLFSRIEAQKEELVDTQDYDKILRLQASITAASNLLGYVHTRVEEARTLQEKS